jgi:hypothetical protein
MVTFGSCFAIHLPNLINAVLRPSNKGIKDSSELSKIIAFSYQTNGLATQVTGGELLHTNNGFYLVVGQKFDGEYANNQYSSTNLYGYKQTYNCSITPISFKWMTNDTLTYTLGSSYVDANNLHRRDLNVVPVINSKGTKVIHIYGGVLTTTQIGGPYLNPIIVSDTTGSININVSNTTQYFNQYAAAHISIFDKKNNRMFTAYLAVLHYTIV